MRLVAACPVAVRFAPGSAGDLCRRFFCALAAIRSRRDHWRGCMVSLIQDKQSCAAGAQRRMKSQASLGVGTRRARVPAPRAEPGNPEPFSRELTIPAALVARQVATMFAEERPSLKPLPLEPFRYYQYGERTVHLDGCVEVEAAYYSAPPGWITRIVQVQWDGLHVRLLDPRTGQLLREHLRQARGGHRIKDEDRSKKTPLGTLQLLDRAGKAGAQIGALCRAMHGEQGQTAVRRIQGVLSLTKKYGAASVDEACATALEVGVRNYHFVRRYLERHPQLPLSLRQVDPLIRQLTLYRDFIETKTKENEP